METMKKNKRIAVFSMTTKQWSLSGKLIHKRSNHGVLVHDGGFLVLGGYSDNDNSTAIKTEHCKLYGTRTKCVDVLPEIDLYTGPPAIMSVPFDYCQND